MTHKRTWPHWPDNCEQCHGARGGVPGNENHVAGRVLCDYCHADLLPSVIAAAEEARRMTETLQALREAKP